MSRWVPQSRADGTPIWVNGETGEVADSLAELVTGRSWDAGLSGLLAAEEFGAGLETPDHVVALGEVVVERMTRVSVHDHVGSMTYSADRCSCSGCGQLWVLARHEDGEAWWLADWYEGDEGVLVVAGRPRRQRARRGASG